MIESETTGYDVKCYRRVSGYTWAQGLGGTYVEEERVRLLAIDRSVAHCVLFGVRHVVLGILDKQMHWMDMEIIARKERERERKTRRHKTYMGEVGRKLSPRSKGQAERMLQAQAMKMKRKMKT